MGRRTDALAVVLGIGAAAAGAVAVVWLIALYGRRVADWFLDREEEG